MSKATAVAEPNFPLAPSPIKEVLSITKRSHRMMNRRQFSGRILTGFALLATMGSSLFLAGCNIFTDILNWVPVGEAALNSVLAVLTGNGILISPQLQSMVSLIEASFDALTAAIKEYQSTTPAPIGALAKVETAFKDIVDNFSAFLSSLNVSGGLLAIVTGLAQIVFSTIAAFMNQLPASSSLKRTLVIGTSLKVGGTSVPVTPKLRTRRVFKKDVNAVLSTGPKLNVVVPQSAYLHISLFEHL